MLSQPPSGTAAFDVMRALISSNTADLIVVDSVAALSAAAELDAEAGDQFVGVQARMMSQSLKALLPFLGLSKTALVFVNQTRSMIGVMYGNPETTPGGSALRFYASVRMRVSRVGNLGPKGKEYGIESRAKVVKNSLAAPFKEATVEIVWRKGICREADVLTVAALVELLRPACQRIEIAGSVRRGKARPNDIEIVAIPAVAAFTQATLFGGLQGGSASEPVNLLNEKCDELLTTGALEKRPDSQRRYCWGTGVKRAVFFQGTDYAPVDLFQVIEPAQWGVIYAIRTGPGDFNHLLVTNRRFGGACPLDRKVAGGRVRDLSQCTLAQARHYAGVVASKFVSLAGSADLPVSVVSTPEEGDFFATLGVPCWSPEQRTERRLVQFVK